MSKSILIGQNSRTKTKVLRAHAKSQFFNVSILLTFWALEPINELIQTGGAKFADYKFILKV